MFLLLRSSHSRRLVAYDRTARKKPYAQHDGNKLRMLLVRKWSSTQTFKSEILGLMQQSSEVENTEALDAEVERLMNDFVTVGSAINVSSFFNTLGMTEQDFDDMVEQESRLDNAFINDKDMADFIDLFDRADVNLIEKLEIHQATLLGMPGSNSFLAGLINRIYETNRDITYEKISEGFLAEIEGFPGRVLSFAFGKDLESYYDYAGEPDAIEEPNEAGEDVGSLITAQSNLSFRIMKSRIEELEQQVINLSGYARQLIARQLKKERSILSQLVEKTENVEPDLIGLSHINKREMVVKIMEFRSVMTEDFGPDLDVEGDEYYTLTNMRLRSWINESQIEGTLTEDESVNYRACVRANELTEEYLYLLSECLKMDIEIWNNSSKIYHQTSHSKTRLEDGQEIDEDGEEFNIVYTMTNWKEPVVTLSQ